MFVIEDEVHAELVGQYTTRDDAVAELQRLASLPWMTTPNRPPCTNAAQCLRRYELAGYDAATTPWRELSREPMLEVSALGVSWLRDPA